MNTEPFNLAVVSAGTGDPSATRLLADRAAERAVALAARHGHAVTVGVIELREIAADISTALTTQLVTPKLQQAITVLGEADGVIAAAPVYKAGPSGLFTSFFGVLDNDLLIAKPVVLAATAGTARHALVADEAMRPMFAYLRTMTVPTALFAAPEDWSDPALATRIDRAAIELVLLMESGFARAVRDESWSSYQHEYGSAGGTELSIDIDTDLMRLAAGGAARPSPPTPSAPATSPVPANPPTPAPQPAQCAIGPHTTGPMSHRAGGTGPEAPLLRCEALGKDYGGLTVLDDVTLTLPPRGLFGLCGPNGAGKSTLLGIIGGSLSPSRGRVLLDGADVPGCRRSSASVWTSAGPSRRCT
jgi:FMN reductase